MKVRYTRPALSRLGELVAALYEQNPFAVQRLAKQLACSIRRIEAFPLGGARVPEFPSRPIRQFFVEPYRFFYYVDAPKKTVWIVSIWHGAQLPAEPRIPAL